MVPKLVDISKRQASHKIYYKDIALTPGEESERAGHVDVAMIQGRTRVIRLRPVQPRANLRRDSTKSNKILFKKLQY